MFFSFSAFYNSRLNKIHNLIEMLKKVKGVIVIQVVRLLMFTNFSLKIHTYFKSYT